MEADILAAIVEDDVEPAQPDQPAPEPVQPKPAPVAPAKQVDYKMPDHSDRFDRIEKSILELSNRMKPVKVEPAKPVAQPPQPQPPAPRPPTPAPASPEITLSTFGTVPW